MIDSIRNNKIDFNRELIAKVVHAIVKAVTDDAPQFRRENHLETNNAARFIAGDYINDNLRNSICNDAIRIHHFPRYVWDGCLLIDSERKNTYSILTAATLAAAKRKHGNKPYYQQSLLFVENGKCEAQYKQLTLAECATLQGRTPFTDEDFTDDFENIMKGTISQADGYRHYIIAYKAEHSEITEIQLLFLDRDFDEIESVDLAEYITPDFAQLTNTYPVENETTKAEATSKVQLKLKTGVKPHIRVLEEEA